MTAKISRQQQRAKSREPVLVVTCVVVYYENGNTSELDINKVMIVDRDSGKPLFDYVIDGNGQ